MTMRLGVVVAGAALAFSACNAGSTAAALVRLEAEMAGARCPHGGIAVLTGLDANSNQTLDDEEIIAAQTKYVCNGAPGTAGTEGQVGPQGDAGQTGLNALSTVTAEPAGTNCRYGGVRVDVGLDTDGNGTLESAEVTGTRYVCDRASTDAIYFGDIVIREAADLALLDGIQIVAGSVYVESTPTGTLSLPDLRVISGQLSFSGSDGGYNEAPARLTSVSFPELRRVDRLYLSYRDDVQSVSLPKLERLHRLEISSMSELTTLSLPLLARADEVNIGSNAKLTSVSLPALAATTQLSVSYNTLLTGLTTTALRSVENYLSINDNAALSHCAALRTVAALERRPRYSVYLAGNDETPTCTTADYCTTRTVAGVGDSLRLCVKEQAFAAAQTDCATFGTNANLLWITSATEWAAVKAAVSDGLLGWPAWIGYSDAAAEGTWVAVNGSSAYDVTGATDFWSPGEPNGGTAENYIELMTNGLANDLPGTEQRAFICRVP